MISTVHPAPGVLSRTREKQRERENQNQGNVYDVPPDSVPAPPSENGGTPPNPLGGNTGPPDGPPPPPQGDTQPQPVVADGEFLVKIFPHVTFLGCRLTTLWNRWWSSRRRCVPRL